METEDDDLSEIDDEAREILEDAMKQNARLAGMYGHPERAEAEDDDAPRAMTQEEVLLKYAGADVPAMRKEMIEKCRIWRERNDKINKLHKEGKMSEFNAINASSELRREKSRAYHNWRLGSIGLSKKKIIEEMAEPYDTLIRILGRDIEPSESEADE